MPPPRPPLPPPPAAADGLIRILSDKDPVKVALALHGLEAVGNKEYAVKYATPLAGDKRVIPGYNKDESATTVGDVAKTVVAAAAQKK